MQCTCVYSICRIVLRLNGNCICLEMRERRCLPGCVSFRIVRTIWFGSNIYVYIYILFCLANITSERHVYERANRRLVCVCICFALVVGDEEEEEEQ